ncbi:Lrp/AsnC family transcriptional regulator [Candidatus Pacearchaeota archaeon]|nr:Lrp/AsnC family transcriptional regulator [Candidatus Pacearchaeota archaeon]
MRYLQKNPKTIKVKLDIKDKKILSILSQNARIPLTQLSKKVSLSRDAINYRIKNYEKNGIIQGYRTIVDMSKFGYKQNHLFIKLNNPAKEVEQRIINKIIKHPFVRAIIKFSGNYDFEIAFISKDIDDLDNVLTKIISDCSGSLQDYELLTISKNFVAKTLPKNFSDYKLETTNKKKIDNKINKKDIKILKILSEDATIPLYKIADKVKLSADAVAYRIRNMINNDIIIKFIPIINYTTLDYNLHTILLNICGLDEKKEKILREFLSSNNNTLWAVKAIGRYNVLIYLLVKNIDDLQETVLKLRSLFPKLINHYETLIAYEEYKYTYFPKDLF